MYHQGISLSKFIFRNFCWSYVTTPPPNTQPTHPHTHTTSWAWTPPEFHRICVRYQRAHWTFKPEHNRLLYLNLQTSFVLCECVCVWCTLHMHKPKASLALAALSLHTMLHSLLCLRLLQPVANSWAWVDWNMDWEKKNAPATQWQRCAVWKVRCNCLYFCNSMWCDQSLKHRYRGVREQRVLNFFSCGHGCLLWTPVEASPVALLSRSSRDLVCTKPLLHLECMPVV